MKPALKRIAIACGGTGGHLFPGLAVGDALVARGCEVTLLVSSREVDQTAVKSAYGMEVESLPVIGLSRNLPRFAASFWSSLGQCRKLFRENRPDAVLAMGGFTSAPPVIAGKLIGARIFLHEANAIPGRAVKLLAPLADEVFVQFPAAMPRVLSTDICATGLPVRSAMEPIEKADARTVLGLAENQPVLLVMGGSQGAQSINQALIESLPRLAKAVPGLQFDAGLQPMELSSLTKGVVANTEGTVTGRGRIDWAADGTVTSTGRFTTDDLDFAAAFGPVKGASGTIEFTDLLNLTTAPGQTIRVASVNPGVEVFDGEVGFALQNGELLAVSGGTWPFMGGQLILRDVDLNLGVSEERRYIFEIVGLDAGTFVTEMELENITATGLFDGTVPIVFDERGNGRIDTGVLISRPPGGTVSYVGGLTYEDLSPIANFAFDALKSLDYSQMRVIMEGPLTGEIVTRVRFDGIRQGEGAKSNFVTKRLASLPLQFRINIKAQFYQLLNNLKSLYDPASVRDPRSLGLLSDDGTRLLRRSITGAEAEPIIDPDDIIPDEIPIQEQESE